MRIPTKCPLSGSIINNMHIWTIENWIKNLAPTQERRTGLRLRFDPGVDPEVRTAVKTFCAWLRTEYYFPLRVPVYVKSTRRVRTMDGDLVCGSFFEPLNEPRSTFITVQG